MANNNTTFTALTTGTRDDSANNGDVYFLDGTATDGRINISSGATWLVGRNTRINVKGNPGPNYMSGTIQGEGLTYVMEPTGGGRADYSRNISNFIIENMEYIMLGNGQIFNHLSNTGNSLTGSTITSIDMSAGGVIIQLGNAEYPSFSLDVKSTNLGTIQFFPAHNTVNFAALPGFQTRGLTILTLRASGSAGSNKHARIYDPEYRDADNDLLPNNFLNIVRVGLTGSSESREYFTLDVSEVKTDNTLLRVVDSLGTVLYNDIALTDENTTIFAQNGTTELVFYNNRDVVPVEVRRITTSTSTGRNTITYFLRRVGFLQISETTVSLISPRNVPFFTIDENYHNTTGSTTIDNPTALYDEIRNLISANLALENDIMIASGDNLEILSGWSLVRDQTITGAVELDTTASEIKVKTGASGLLSDDNFVRFIGSVDTTFNTFTTMNYIVVAGQTNLRLTGLVNGTSVSVVRDSDSIEVAQGLATGSALELAFAYVAPDYAATIRTIRNGFVQADQLITVTEGILNILIQGGGDSFGQTDTTTRIKNVNGVEINAAPIGQIDALTTPKTFDVLTPAKDTRLAMSAIMRSWTDNSLNQIVQPCNVDDVRGLSISDGWDFTTTSKSTFLIDEGYVVRNAAGAVTDLQYNIKIADNNTNVRYEIYYNGVGQGIVTTAANTPLNILVDIDHTQNNVSIIVKAKHPQFVFKIVEEQIITAGVIVSEKFRLSETTYLVASDAAVLVDETAGVGTEFSHVPGVTVRADANGVDRTFSEGELRLRTGTTTFADVISQIAAIAAVDFPENDKLFTLIGTTAINVHEGYFVTINQIPLSGSLQSSIQMFDDDGLQFATPIFKNIFLTVPSSWTGVDIEYVVIEDSSALTTPVIVTDADGNNMRGSIAASDLPTVLSKQQTTDLEVRIIWGAAGLEIGQHEETLDSDGINLIINPSIEAIVLYADESLSVDDPDAGTKAYFPDLEDIVVTESTRKFTIPNEIRACELSYVYRKWKDWLEADFDRLVYGLAWVGVNQNKPATATNNVYLYNPNWFISFGWVIDVESDRDTATDGLVEFQASEIGRYDETHGFPIQNGGVVYSSPMANGEAPVLKIIVGFTTEALTSINNRLNIVQNRVSTVGVEINATDTATIERINENTSDVVYIDTDATVNGTGTFTSPFNALTVGSTNIIGASKVNVKGILNLNASLSNIEFIGDPFARLAIGGELDGNIMTNVTFRNLRMDGISSESCIYFNCEIGFPFVCAGSFFNCTIIGELILDPSAVTSFADSFNATGSDEIEITGGLAGAFNAVRFTNHSGTINLSGVNNPDDNYYINLNGGTVNLDASCTSGRVEIDGIFELVDNSAGVNIVINSRAASQQIVVDTNTTVTASNTTLARVNENTSDVVYVNTTATVNGTGTATSPFNTIGAASVNIIGAQKVNLRGALTLNANLSDIEFIGDPFATVNIGTRVMTNVTFRDLTVTGNSTDTCKYYNCVIPSSLECAGDFLQCKFTGNVNILDGGNANFVDCYDGILTPPIQIVGGVNTSSNIVKIVNYSGSIIFSSINNASDLYDVHLNGGKVILNASCTLGTLNIDGIFDLVDNSAGTTVNTVGRAASQNTLEASNTTIDTINTTTAATGTTVATVNTTVTKIDANASDTIYIDTDSTVTGTGTQVDPYSGFGTDMVNVRGKSKVYIKGSQSITINGNISYIEFIGGPALNLIDLGTNTLVHVTFRNLRVSTGASSNTCKYYDCVIETTTSGGDYIRCGLSLTVTMGDGLDANFIDCYDDVDRSPLDFVGGSSTTSNQVRFINYAGAITFSNINNDSDNYDIHVLGGTIELTSSCTAGIVNLYGIFDIVNESTGLDLTTVGRGAIQSSVDSSLSTIDTINTTVNTINTTTAATGTTVGTVNTTLTRVNENTSDVVYFDSTATVNGTGTATSPFNVPGGVSDNSNISGFNKVFVTGELTIRAALSNIEIIGDTGSTMSTGGQVVTSCTFRNLRLNGIYTDTCVSIGCVIIATTKTAGTFINCEFEASISMNDDSLADFIDCYETIKGDRFFITGPGNTGKFFRANINRLVGDVGIGTMGDNRDIVDIHMEGGAVEIFPSCTEGVINLSGTFELTDNNGGTTVNVIGRNADHAALIAELNTINTTTAATGVTVSATDPKVDLIKTRVDNFFKDPIN